MSEETAANVAGAEAAEDTTVVDSQEQSVPENTDTQTQEETAEAVVETTETASTKPKSKKKSSRKSKSSNSFTLKQATANALKTGNASESESLIMIPISRIAKNDNPRHEPANLSEKGYSLIGEAVTIPSEEEDGEDEIRLCLRDMALSDEIETVRGFVDLIESYESPCCRLINPKGKVDFVGTDFECREVLKEKKDRKGWKVEEHPSADQSITELASDLIEFDPDGVGINLVSVLANPIGKSGDWNLIDGGRRVTAILYNHAKSRLLIADGDENAPKNPYPAVTKAEDRNIRVDDQMNIAVGLNRSRKEMSEYQLGKVYYDFAQQNDMSMKDAAKHFNVPYGTFRNRHALAIPYEPEKRNDEGEVVKKSKGLSPADRKAYLAGEMGLTHASRKALGERTKGDGAPVAHRRKAATMKQLEQWFDETPRSNEERIKTLSECMGFESPKKALKESDARIEEQDRKAMQAA